MAVTLYHKAKYDEIGKYLNELDGRIEEISTISTGNAIADYFVNEVIHELKKSGQISYQVIGKFPVRMNISDVDLCVLLGNALDNAKEALAKVEGKRELYMEIRNVREVVLIRISNSAVKPGTKLLESAKADKDKHGYGTQNMKWVVEKYDGDIKWYYEEGTFNVEMEI